MRVASLGFFTVALFTVAGLVAGAGCSQNATTGLTPPASADHAGPKKHQKRPGEYGAIKHIFVIIQENRSLNNLFAGSGIPGANTTLTGEEVTGSGVEQPIPLVAATIGPSQDIDHCYYDAAKAINAVIGDGSVEEKPMDGFNNETIPVSCPGTKRAGKYPYQYVPKSPGVQPYWDLANSWILGSNFYPTELGPSFVAHLNIIAGTTEYKTDVEAADYPYIPPWGCSNPLKNSIMRNLTPHATPGPYGTPRPCYDQFHTIADILDCLYCKTGTTGESAVQWRYYAPTISGTGSHGGGIWSAFQAIKRVYHGGSGGDWSKDVISPDYQIFSDLSTAKSSLKNVGVTWVVPEEPWSDHADPGLTDEGASWVGDIVNAIGGSPLWDSSVIVVLWDDWGGWYDPAPPPTLRFQGCGTTATCTVDRGYGIRTPMLIISPYDAQNGAEISHVSTEQFEPGSILKFIEQVFFNGETLGSLPCDYYTYYDGYGCNLGYTDATANSIGDVLNMNQPARPYVPVKTKYPYTKFTKGYSGYYYNDVPPDNE